MILVIGDIIYDEYWQGSCERLCPEAPVPVVLNPIINSEYGGAANVERSLKSLGHKTCFLYDSENVATKRRIYANGHLLCRIDDEIDEMIEKPFRLQITDFHTNKVKYAVLSDYNKSTLKNPFGVITELNKKSIKCLVDPKKKFEHYRNAWLIKPNKKEFEQEIGIECDMASIGDYCKRLSDVYNIPNILVTLGKDGMFLYANGLERHFEATAKRVIDVTGAGDVVMAALAHYLDKEYSLMYACKMANKLAGISVSQFGSYTLTPEDIKTVEGDIVVFTNGCFDILHAGHFHFLRESKKLGSKLIVGLNSDKSVRRLKGKDRPINKQKDRQKALELIDFVDKVIPFNEDTPYELIKKIKPDIVTKGGDYKLDEVVGKDLAKVKIIPTLKGFSTTKVINATRRKSK